MTEACGHGRCISTAFGPTPTWSDPRKRSASSTGPGHGLGAAVPPPCLLRRTISRLIPAINDNVLFVVDCQLLIEAVNLVEVALVQRGHVLRELAQIPLDVIAVSEHFPVELHGVPTRWLPVARCASR